VTIDELRALIARFTYKPNSVFKLRKGYEPDFFIVEVKVWCDDVEKPGQKNYAVHEIPLYIEDLYEWTEDLVIYRIQNAIHSIEDHEMREWLRLDGFFLSDPHPEKSHGKNYLRKT
jgi:hypothetical protein